MIFWRIKGLIAVVVLVLIVFALWLLQDARERRKTVEREAYYQSMLTRYTGELKPGMTRKEVEQYIHGDAGKFKQMCCVANFKGGHVSLVAAGWDDLVKVGEESIPWFCSEHNVYIAFEFNPKSQGERPDTNDSDLLKRVSIFRQLEGCL